MQRFRFQLDTVLDWRRTQFEVAEAKLRGLLAERDSMESEIVVLDGNVEAERTRLHDPATGVPERQAFDGYVRWAKLHRERLRNRIAECEQRIETQRAKVLDARRNVELLEKLRSKRAAEWQAASDKEVEQLAADSHLARLSRGAI